MILLTLDLSLVSRQRSCNLQPKRLAAASPIRLSCRFWQSTFIHSPDCYTFHGSPLSVPLTNKGHQPAYLYDFFHGQTVFSSSISGLYVHKHVTSILSRLSICRHNAVQMLRGPQAILSTTKPLSAVGDLLVSSASPRLSLRHLTRLGSGGVKFLRQDFKTLQSPVGCFAAFDPQFKTKKRDMLGFLLMVALKLWCVLVNWYIVSIIFCTLRAAVRQPASAGCWAGARG